MGPTEGGGPGRAAHEAFSATAVGRGKLKRRVDAAKAPPLAAASGGIG